MAVLPFERPTVGRPTVGWSDAALWRSAAGGDVQAFATLYARHQPALQRYCRSILRDDEDAQDAVQQAMAKAFAALDDREIDVRPWLFRIAHNESISLLRRRRPTVELPEDLTGHEDVTDVVLRRTRLRDLEADLAALGTRQRAALVLRELNGLSHAEIAGVLGGSPRSIAQALFEARSALQDSTVGRALPCQDVQRRLSDGDGRVLRGRSVRAHLRVCASCRHFRARLEERPAELRALFPPLPAIAAGALAAKLLPGTPAACAATGGASGSGAAGVAAAASGGTAVAAPAGLLGAAIAGKAAIVAVVAAGGIAGGVVAAVEAPPAGAPQRDSAAAQQASDRPAPRAPSTRPSRQGTSSPAPPTAKEGSASQRGAGAAGARSVAATGRGAAPAGTPPAADTRVRRGAASGIAETVPPSTDVQHRAAEPHRPATARPSRPSGSRPESPGPSSARPPAAPDRPVPTAPAPPTAAAPPPARPAPAPSSPVRTDAVPATPPAVGGPAAGAAPDHAPGAVPSPPPAGTNTPGDRP